MKNYLSFSSLLLVVFLQSCTSNNVEPQLSTVTINFQHLLDDQPLELDKLQYVNAVGQPYSVKTLKYFVSRITFHRNGADDILEPDVHYVDIRDTTTLSFNLSHQLPFGDYSSISFVYGLVPEDNITGSLGVDLDRLMEWPVPMGGGYHYMKLEGEYEFDSQVHFYNFHAGMLGGTAYEVHVALPDSDFSATSETEDITLEMNIENWFQNPVNWDFDYFGSAIMGNAEAQQTIQKNGADVFTVSISNTIQ